MKYKNAFFQIIIKENNMNYIKIYPAMNDGAALTYKEVSEYLAAKKILDYDLKELNRVLTTATEPAEVFLNSEKLYPIDEHIRIINDQGTKRAIARFYPPSTGGSCMTKEELMTELVRNGIKHGIVEKNVDAFIANRIYCTTILIAQQTLPVEGTSASIKYHFTATPAAKPRVNEDGSVDFHQLDIISHVKAGDVLAELTMAVNGTTGKDILGNVLRPRDVEHLVLHPGENTNLSEDKCTLSAVCDGHVTMNSEGKISVSNVFEVKGDVDTSTGDLDFNGNIEIHGSVLTGFTVKARGDIVVDGAVEGASLYAGGQIILKRGIQGMNRAVLKADSNIVTKFIENAVVTAGGYIQTDAIMHSKVSAKGEITVDGKNGFVTGGEVRSGTQITVKTAGSTMGTTTNLQVGVDPAVVDTYKELDKDISVLLEEKEKSDQMIDIYKKRMAQGVKLDAAKMKQLQLTLQNNDKIIKEIEEKSEHRDRLKEEIETQSSGQIRISSIAYPGVKLIISNVVYHVRKEMHRSRFVRKLGDIEISPF